MRIQVPFLAALAAASLLYGKESATQRLDEATAVISEVMGAPDKGIPKELVESAKCAVVVPGLKKGAFIVGAKYGKGFVTCRRSGTGWSAPAAIKVEGGSFGLQIGGSETDVVMLVMNERGAQKLMSSQFTLGGEGEVAAGPVGRSGTAQTDAYMRAEILSWSRSRGVFAGLALTGATLRQDDDANKELYGRPLDNKEILNGNVPAPAAAANFLATIGKYSSADVNANAPAKSDRERSRKNQ